MTLATSPDLRSRSPVKAYQDVDLASRIESAAPHRLVAMLYDDLAITLAVMERAVQAGETRCLVRQHERATSLLLMLETSLDPVGGGDLAVSLGRIYRQMRRRLAAGRTGDAAAIKHVAEGIANLSAAWAGIGGQGA